MNKMTPKQIKRALEDAGYTQARVAEELGVSAPTISLVIKGTSTSHRIRCFIAKAIQTRVEQVWKIKDNPTKVGRPSTRNIAA